MTPRDAIRAAQEALQEADRVLTIAASVRFLGRRGFKVRPNTVRHWCDRGAVPFVVVGVNRKAIPISALLHIAACPLCVDRLR